MKITVSIIRYFTGLLFIFSGMVKAIDPRGLAYKMEEFFEAWSSDGFLPGLMHGLHRYSLGFSIWMITLEVAVGLALILGWKSRWTTRILLALMLFFTGLTAYVLFSGKIRACGCFGDCIPLTPEQTFGKDILLTLFAILLVWKHTLIFPLAKPWPTMMLLIAGILLAWYIQQRALTHLPLKDCLPYKEGNNMLALRKMPADAVQDVYDYQFLYSKNGKTNSFPVTALPDSTWTFVERKQILVKKGRNNIPLINDFSLSTAEGADSTEAILSQSGSYYLYFVKDMIDYPIQDGSDVQLIKKLMALSPVYIITAQRKETERHFESTGARVFTTDAIAIKTAARAKPTLYQMRAGIVQKKWGWADFDHVTKVVSSER